MPTDNDNKARGYPYKVINQVNASYDASLVNEIEDLYVGGFAIAKKARQYLPKLAFERDKQYDERCAIASYFGFFSQIVDQFVSDVAVQTLSITPPADAADSNTPGELPDVGFYTSLCADADLCGHSFEDVALDVFRSALKFRRAIIAIDAPTLDEAEGRDATASSVDKSNRLYLYEVPVNNVIDWKLDRIGRYTWILIKNSECERQGIGGDYKWTTETFVEWFMDGGFACWRKYSITFESDKTPDDNALVTLVAEGRSDFREIPFVLLELPVGFWVGNKVGVMAKEHWQRRSSLIGAENRSMVAIPVAFLGSEVGAMGGELPSEAQSDANRGENPVKKFESKGFLALGAGDRMEFIEPSGHAYEILDKQIEAVKEAAFAITHQMAASIKPTGAALGRSGMSKQKDEDKTVKVLNALGKIVREFAIKIYTIISESRGEDVKWVAHGMDQFDKVDREQLIEESTQMQGLQIPSETFWKAYKTKIAEKLLDSSDPALLATIRDEIEKGVEEEMRQKENEEKLLLDQQKEAHETEMQARLLEAKQPGDGVPESKTDVDETKMGRDKAAQKK